jgi:hypothetical protein
MLTGNVGGATLQSASARQVKHGGEVIMRPWRGWCAFGAACLIALHASLAAADPQVGWWWNPDESGRGYFVESQGGIMYMAAYLYAGNGRARWLVSGGPNADPNH